MNFTHHHGCGCPGGNPPCSYCVDTYSCESCNNRHYAEYSEEHQKYGFICQDCQEYHAPPGWYYWLCVVFAWLITILVFPLLIFTLASYNTYQEYNKNRYMTHSFFRFYYDYNFTEQYYFTKARD